MSRSDTMRALAVATGMGWLYALDADTAVDDLNFQPFTIRLVDGSTLEGETAGKRYRLKSALWKYTLLPGLLELQLAEQLSEHGLDVTLWPDVDRSDLRITQGAMTTDLDAKVWVSPLALGRYLENLEYSSPRWIVIPDYQKSHLDWLRNICAKGLQVFTQTECIKELTQRANPF